MIIRAATADDILLIHQLANEIWWPAYQGIISDEQIRFMLQDIYSVSALQQQLNNGMEFLLAECDDIPVGFAEYSIIESAKKIFKLNKLYILPLEQGKGGGKKLVGYVENLVRERGGNILELNVNRGNPALNFYKNLGFEICQAVDTPYYDFVLNDYVMRKKL